MWALIEQCWAQDANQRPTASHISMQLLKQDSDPFRDPETPIAFEPSATVEPSPSLLCATPPTPLSYPVLPLMQPPGEGISHAAAVTMPIISSRTTSPVPSSLYPTQPDQSTPPQLSPSQSLMDDPDFLSLFFPDTSPRESVPPSVNLRSDEPAQATRSQSPIPSQATASTAVERSSSLESLVTLPEIRSLAKDNSSNPQLRPLPTPKPVPPMTPFEPVATTSEPTSPSSPSTSGHNGDAGAQHRLRQVSVSQRRIQTGMSGWMNGRM